MQICSLLILVAALTIPVADPLAAKDGHHEAPGRLVDLGGFDLHYTRSGDGARPVVFFHGGGDASGVWLPVIERLPATATAIAIDAHGRGHSEWGHRERTLRQIAADFRRLLEIEEISGPFVLVGHSLGGLIVQYFAREHLSDVAGMVLVDPTPLDRLGQYEREDGSPYMVRDRDRARDIPVPQTKGAGVTIAAATEEFVRTNDYSQFSELLTPTQIAALEASTNRPRLRPEGADLNGYWSEEIRDLHAWWKPHWLGERPVRVIYVRSDYTGYLEAWFEAGGFSKASAARMTRESVESYRDASRNGHALLVDAGHHIHIERPDLVASAIKEVLAATSARGSTP